MNNLNLFFVVVSCRLLVYHVFMSRILGIDYGTKNVGLALSDESRKIAFPKEILHNDENLILNIKDFCEKENIAEIVIGQSLTGEGQPNPVQAKIIKFIKKLEEETRLPVNTIPEIFSTIEARRYTINKEGTRKRQSRKTKLNKENLADSSAAAIILQRYLEKISNI